jgi:D-aminopeptidase
METPIFLCSSMAVGRVYDGAVSAISEVAQGAGWDEPLMPIVGECDDSFLSTPLPVQVTEHEVRAALADAASAQRSGGDARPAEGVVGAGTGMHGFRYKGGIGTASRVVAPRDRRHRFDAAAPDDGPPYTIGVVALVNFGLPDRLSIAGVPVGRILQAEGWPLRAETAPSPGAHAHADRRRRA